VFPRWLWVTFVQHNMVLDESSSTGIGQSRSSCPSSSTAATPGLRASRHRQAPEPTLTVPPSSSSSSPPSLSSSSSFSRVECLAGRCQHAARPSVAGPPPDVAVPGHLQGRGHRPPAGQALHAPGTLQHPLGLRQVGIRSTLVDQQHQKQHRDYTGHHQHNPDDGADKIGDNFLLGCSCSLMVNHAWSGSPSTRARPSWRHSCRGRGTTCRSSCLRTWPMWSTRWRGLSTAPASSFWMPSPTWRVRRPEVL
jgi:hypothetical protein